MDDNLQGALGRKLLAADVMNPSQSRAELMLFAVPQISRILPAGRFARQGSELAAAVSAVGAAMLKIATCWQAYATVSI